jgi:cytochrome c biogenesis protein CcmG/thiol:disulfide interchange protein DsbE
VPLHGRGPHDDADASTLNESLRGGEKPFMKSRSLLEVGLLALVAATSFGLGCGGASGDTHTASSGSGRGLVGQAAPDFSAPAVANGKGKVSLEELRGKVVLVDFWGTFCEPCKKSFPKLQTLYGKYAGSGLKIVGISEDEAEDKSKISDFASTYGAKFTLAWDGDKSIAEAYKPETMPSSYLVDRRGVVRFTHVGYHDGEEDDIDREIQELLSK